MLNQAREMLSRSTANALVRDGGQRGTIDLIALRRQMGRLAMTTRRWMVFVFVVAVAIGTILWLRRLAAAKVSAFTQAARDELGLPADDTLADYNLPIPSELGHWIDLDHFLSRFGLIVLALVVVVAWGAIAFFPSKAIAPSVPVKESSER